MTQQGRLATSHGPPLVGVSCCQRDISGALFHTVLGKYLQAVTDVSRCDVVLIPALGDRSSGGRLDLSGLVDRLDGVLLTGARSMVAPDRYGGNEEAGVLYDAARDATTLALATLSVERATPLLGICRGFQEICCAFGGALETDLAGRPDRSDHRARQDVAYEDKYLPTHAVTCRPGGLLSQIAAEARASDRFDVNSLHLQGAETLGSRLCAEAWSDDGLVEAISVASCEAFALGVQWHPEWHLEQHPVNRRIFERFGEACRTRQRLRDQARVTRPG